MNAHRLRRRRRRKLLHHDRRVDEIARAQIPDVRIAEHLREPLRADDVGARRWQLSAIDERGAAIVRVHEPRDRHRITSVVEAAEVVEADHDVLTASIDGNRHFRLGARRPLVEPVCFTALVRLSLRALVFPRRLGPEQFRDARERRCLETGADVPRTPPSGPTGRGHLAANGFAGARRARLIRPIICAQAREQAGEREAQDDCQRESLTHG